MGITPQFIYGKDGLPTNVVISFEEWQRLQESSSHQPPAGQMKETQRRILHAKANPESLIPLDDFLKEFDRDNETL